MQVNMHEAKSQLSALAEKAWSGVEVIIAKAGKPYLILSPYRGGRSTPRKPGRYKDQVWMAEDFDETPEEFVRAFGE